MTANMFDLSGKVALVTGGNGGIGLGMAEGLAQQGATTIIWGRNEEKNAKALERLETTGATVKAVGVDVADHKAIEKNMADLLSEFGRIDFAMANAGISVRRNTMFDVTEDDLNEIEGVNLNGVFHTLRTAAQSMKERAEDGDPGGSLGAVASTAAIHGAAGNSHYGMTKGGVVTMVRAMAVELGRYGIRVNSICPGWIRSEMTEAAQAWDKFNEKVISRVPLGKDWGDPEDFAGIAVYLASDASRFHTGDMIVIDGGYTIF